MTGWASVRGSRARRLSLGVLALALVSACSLRNVSCSAPQVQPPEAVPLTMEQPIQASTAPVFEIAFLGDSLTAGYGLLSQQSFPTLVQEMFEAEGYREVEARNAGLSGDTTAGGLRRVEHVLGPNVHVVVVALGGNDLLRGLSAEQTHDNLERIIDAALAHQTAVLLAGMQAPTNLGIEYREAFRGAYERLALEYAGRIEFVPFLLEGVAGVPTLNQADGIHPNQEGAKRIAELLYPRLRTMVDRASVGGTE